MLPRAHRLRTASDYEMVLRGRRGRGRLQTARAGGRLLVVHGAELVDDAPHEEADPQEQPLPRVGFVVSRAVGVAVVRNRTKRVLRHLVLARLAGIPAGTGLVVRAQPAAAGATTAALATELDRLLDQVLRRLR